MHLWCPTPNRTGEVRSTPPGRPPSWWGGKEQWAPPQEPVPCFRPWSLNFLALQATGVQPKTIIGQQSAGSIIRTLTLTLHFNLALSYLTNKHLWLSNPQIIDTLPRRQISGSVIYMCIGLLVKDGWYVCCCSATNWSRCCADRGRARTKRTEQQRQSFPTVGQWQRRQWYWLAGNCSHVPADSVCCTDGGNGHSYCQADQGDDTELFWRPFCQLDRRSGWLGMILYST